MVLKQKFGRGVSYGQVTETFWLDAEEKQSTNAVADVEQFTKTVTRSDMRTIDTEWRAIIISCEALSDEPGAVVRFKVNGTQISEHGINSETTAYGNPTVTYVPPNLNQDLVISMTLYENDAGTHKVRNFKIAYRAVVVER